MLNLKLSDGGLFCAWFLSILCALSLQAQPASSVDGVTLNDGKVCSLRGGLMDILTENIELPFNVKVDTNGTFKVDGGKAQQLEAGQVIRSDGWLVNPDGSVQPVFDHVVVKAGRVMVVRDGQTTPLSEPMTFPNNLQITPDGTCSFPGGSPTRLMDGQLFQLDGTVIQSKDTVTLKNGQVVMQKEGSLIPLAPTQIMGMNDGTRVRGNGLIEKQDGATIQLREGQIILLDGANVKP
jgi:hypothetical protein